MTSTTFWASLAAKGLRGQQPTTWASRELKSRVALAAPLVPGQPRQETTEKEPTP